MAEVLSGKGSSPTTDWGLIGSLQKNNTEFNAQHWIY